MLYHSQRGKAVDAIVHREQAFQPARFWVVPPDSQTWLPTEDVVRRHCHGMQDQARCGARFQRTQGAPPNDSSQTLFLSKEGLCFLRL